MSEDKDNEVVCYILMRNDLGMSPGKMVAQGGHAVQEMLDLLFQCSDWLDYKSDSNNWYFDWRKSNVKVVLSVTEQELKDVSSKVQPKYFISEIIDEGRTEIAPNTLTCACMQPLPRKIAKEFVGHLKLLK